MVTLAQVAPQVDPEVVATLDPGVVNLAPQVAEAPASEDINIFTPKAVASGAVSAAEYVPAIVPGGELELLIMYVYLCFHIWFSY